MFRQVCQKRRCRPISGLNAFQAHRERRVDHGRRYCCSVHWERDMAVPLPADEGPDPSAAAAGGAAVAAFAQLRDGERVFGRND